MISKLSEIIVFLGLTLASIALWFNADALPTSKRYAQVDSDLWPKIVFGALAICCAIQMIKAVSKALKAQAETEATGTGKAQGYYLRLGLISALVLGYFFALNQIGFLFATVIFLWAAAWVLPYRNLLAKLLFAPLFTVMLALFFSYALSLPLPRGEGIFYDLSQALF